MQKSHLQYEIERQRLAFAIRAVVGLILFISGMITLHVIATAPQLAIPTLLISGCVDGLLIAFFYPSNNAMLLSALSLITVISTYLWVVANDLLNCGGIQVNPAYEFLIPTGFLTGTVGIFMYLSAWISAFTGAIVLSGILATLRK